MGDVDTLQTLITRLEANTARARTYEAYYDGELRLAALGLSLPPEMRQLQTVVNWPRLTVDSLENRINVQGFRLGGADETDDRLWSWWQANNLDEEAPLGHLESFVQGRAFVAVGYDDEDDETPLITVESARNMVADFNERSRKVDAAARVYDYDVAGQAQSATLYLPDATVLFKRSQGRWVTDGAPIEHKLGRTPVVPMVNRARLSDRGGRSEMTDVMGLTDAACRSLTNLQGAQELMAVPTRYVLGITPEDMKDKDGNQVTRWEAYLGRFNTLSDPNAKVVQLSASDLRNFTETINAYAMLVSSVTGLPAHYLGQTSENPASADAIRSAEARHVNRAERKCQALAGVWEEVMRLGLLLIDGKVDDDAKRMETVFADCSTPTQAQTTDSVVKLVAAGIIPVEAAWEDLGYSAEKRRRLADQMASSDLSKLVSSVTGDVNEGQGMTPQQDLKANADAMGVLIRSGADPESAAAAVGLSGLKFTGAVPVTLRVPEDDARDLEQAP